MRHIGRHRHPRPIRIDPESIEDNYMAAVVRHRGDGLSIDDAMTLAGIDADDALTAWRLT